MDKKQQIKNNNTIYDLRFFDVQTYTNPIIFFIHNRNPNTNLINLINELDCYKIYSEIILNSFKQDYDIDLLVHKEKDQKKIQSMIKSEEFLKIEESKDYIMAGIDRAIELFNEESEGHNIKLNPKLILYLSYEEIDELYFFMSTLNFYHIHHPHIQIIIIFDESIVFRLNKGMNMIYFPYSLFTKKGVGFYPIKKSVISTKGFKWDITNWETEIGKNLSTSNEFVDNIANIYVHEGELFFTSEISLK